MARIKDYDEDLSAPKLLRERERERERARDSKGGFIKKDPPPYLGAEQVLKPKEYFHFDSHGNYKGSSMNLDAIVCFVLTWFKLLVVALMMLLWPIVFIYALNDGIKGYPFKKYAIPYIFILVVWFIIFLYGLVS
nr:MAG: hypothetical protein [Bacteriophage sp.]